MKRLLCCMLVVSLTIACNSSYGDKYNVNEKSEIYYKDGFSENDAKMLGDFLLENGYFDSLSEKSVQLLKERDTINVKFVVDKEKVTKDGSVVLFSTIGSAISTNVFSAQPLKIVLADPYMKGFKEVVIPGTNTDKK